MCTRLIVNITQVYIPMFSLETLKLSKVCTAFNILICSREIMGGKNVEKRLTVLVLAGTMSKCLIYMKSPV